jgi:hypothetical protein
MSCMGCRKMRLALWRINKEEDVELLLSHWHCILPVAAIIIVMIFQSRGKKNRNGK